LSWTHYKILLSIKDEAELTYYMNLRADLHLSTRKLENKIKLNEYEKLPMDTKNKLVKVSKPTLRNVVQNPIIVYNPKNVDIYYEAF